MEKNWYLNMSASELFDVVIVRFGGELSIKAAWTRKLYERRLVANIKAVLRLHAIPYSALVRRFGRFYLRTTRAKDAAAKLARVFGISSLSPALETTSKLNDIVEKSICIAGSSFKKGHRFAVRCRRVGDHPFTSHDVCREIGHQIMTAYPQLGLSVDLKHPDVILGVEVREDRTFLSTEIIRGVDGLPLGTQPRVVSLLKGDLNSTVASWMVMKRGCPIVPIHFDTGLLAEDASLDRALNAAKALFEWSIGFPRRLKVIPHSQNLTEISEKCPDRVADLLCKRLMFRIAERIADTERAEGIVTGESFGEESPLTLSDLNVEDEVVGRYPVHRPLAGFGGEDALGWARTIGLDASFALGKRRRLGFRRRKTAVKLESIKLAEEKLDIEELVQKSLKSIRTIDC